MPSNQHTPAAIGLIEDEYRHIKKHAKACELYTYVLDNHPDSFFAFWAQQNLAMSNIARGRLPEAAQAAEAVLADFPNDSRLPGAAKNIADAYQDAKAYDKACELYQYVVDSHHGSHEALWSQMALAVTHIKAENDTAAQNALQTLKATFPSDNRLPAALITVADQYRAHGNTPKAEMIYQTIATNHPTAKTAVWAQQNLVLSHIRRQDGTESDALATLLVGFTTDRGLTRAINTVAGLYKALKQPKKATQIWENALDQVKAHPNANTLLWPRTAQIVWSIALDKYVSPDDISNLVRDFGDDPGTPDALAQIANTYWGQAFIMKEERDREAELASFESAVATWEYVFTQWPDADMAPEGHYFAGKCLTHLGRPEQALENYRQLTQNWPQSHFIANAWFEIARTNERLSTRLGRSSDTTAEITQTCQTIVEQYPDAVFARHAGDILAKFSKAAASN